MADNFFDGKVFKGINFSENKIAKGIYEDCSFILCDLSECDLSDITFGECLFDSCNLSNIKAYNTSLKELTFINCKIIGLHFEDCNDILFSANFTNSNLDYCTFYKRKLKGTLFKNCSMSEVDFTEADLAESSFDNCDLNGAVFYRTNLEKSDLRSAYNYNIDPEENRILKAKFSLGGISGLLNRYNIEIEQ